MSCQTQAVSVKGVTQEMASLNVDDAEKEKARQVKETKENEVAAQVLAQAEISLARETDQEKFVKAIKDNRNATSLDMSFTSFPLTVLFPLKNLKTLVMDGYKGEDADIEGLEKQTKLTSLSVRFFSKGRLNDPTEFPKYLKPLQALQHLDLMSCSYISNETLYSTLPHLANLRSLELYAFNVSGGPMTDDLIPCLKGCTQLTKLDVSFADITDEGLKMLAQVVPQLEDVSINKCRAITVDGIEKHLLQLNKLDRFTVPVKLLDQANEKLRAKFPSTPLAHELFYKITFIKATPKNAELAKEEKLRRYLPPPKTKPQTKA